MRCSCCNRNLNDYESTLMHAETGNYLDTCIKCLDGLGVPVVSKFKLDAADTEAPSDWDEIELPFTEEEWWEDDE